MTVPEDPVGDPPPVDELDELASARLDGAVAPDDVAGAADPAVEAEVARREARFARVRAVLAEPVAVDADAREAAIAAALAALPAPGAADELATRRSERARRRGAGLKLVGAAAAVVAAVALGAAVLTDGGGDDVEASGDDASTEGAEALDEAGGSPGFESPEEGADGDAGTASVPVALGDLGEFDDVDTLLDAATAALPVTSDEDVEVTRLPEGATAGDLQCAAARFEDELGVLVATATVGGVPVAVLVVDDGDTVVVDLTTCAVLGRASP